MLGRLFGLSVPISKDDIDVMSKQELEDFIKINSNPKKTFDKRTLQEHLVLLSHAEECLRILNVAQNKKLLDEIIFEGQSEFAARLISIDSIMRQLMRFPETYEVSKQKYETLMAAINLDLTGLEKNTESVIKLMRSIIDRAQVFITEQTTILTNKTAARRREEKNAARFDLDVSPPSPHQPRSVRSEENSEKSIIENMIVTMRQHIAQQQTNLAQKKSAYSSSSPALHRALELRPNREDAPVGPDPHELKCR